MTSTPFFPSTIDSRVRAATTPCSPGTYALAIALEAGAGPLRAAGGTGRRVSREARVPRGPVPDGRAFRTCSGTVRVRRTGDPRPRDRTRGPRFARGPSPVPPADPH